MAISCLHAIVCTDVWMVDRDAALRGTDIHLDMYM